MTKLNAKLLSNLNLDLKEKEILSCKEALLNFEASGASNLNLKEVSDLFLDDHNFWNLIKNLLRDDFRSFDRLLLKLHYLREFFFSEFEREKILKFLVLAYLATSDVRYFNEFLFFCKNNLDLYYLVAIDHFKKCLDEDGIHLSPITSEKTVSSWESSEIKFPNLEKVRIGLFGNPSEFVKEYEVLSNEEIELIPIHFSYRKSRLTRFLYSTPLFYKPYFRLKGVSFFYDRFDDHSLSDFLGEKIKSKKIDIAVHRLGFILKNNLIKNVPLGILNCHLGVLPAIRGKSSVEFSLLHGFPPAITVHQIDEGVDTGPILKIFTFTNECQNCDSVQEVKEFLITKMSDCFISSLLEIKKKGMIQNENEYKQGLQYYSMHPDLTDYINYTFFKKRV